MPKAFVFAVVSAAVTVIMATTGCAYLLLGSCGLYGCPRLLVTSLPPRDNPLALALSTPTDRDRVEAVLNGVINAQSGMAATTPCAEAAVAGCRYTFLVQNEQSGPPASPMKVGCFLLDVAVEARSRGGARLGPLKISPTACPAAIPPVRRAE